MTIRQQLKRAGLRLTLPRLKVMEMLQANPQQQLTAEAVYMELQQQGHSIGLTSIYRALADFEQAQLVDRQRPGQAKSLYQLA